MTAEEFLLQKSKSKDLKIILSALRSGEYTKELMIEFAKYHVQEALKAASKQSKMDVSPYDQEEWEYVDDVLIVSDLISNMEDGEISINPNSILKAYPLENIK